jgi:hypothetical protein
MKRVLLILFLLLTLTACAQDPWKAEQIKAQAEADQIAAQSLQNSLNQEQNRKQAADLHAIQMQDEQRKQARKDAIEQDVRNAWDMFIRLVSFVVTAAVIFTIAVGTHSTVQAYRTVATGIANATVQAAEIRSRLIYLDDGRQFPAILNQNLITDITTGSTVATNQTHPGDPQQIAGAIANRHVGIVAKETRRAGKDVADSVPLAQNPPIIEAKFSDVKEYIELMLKQRDNDDI